MRTTLGTEIDHPEAHFLDVLTEMGLPMELDARQAGCGCGTTGSRCAASRRLPADARHAADPHHARVLRDGRTVFEQRRHVRLKESDRVVSMLQLNRMGGDVELSTTR